MIVNDWNLRMKLSKVAMGFHDTLIRLDIVFGTNWYINSEFRNKYTIKKGS